MRVVAASQGNDVIVVLDDASGAIARVDIAVTSSLGDVTRDRGYSAGSGAPKYSVRAHDDLARENGARVAGGEVADVRAKLPSSARSAQRAPRGRWGVGECRFVSQSTVSTRAQCIA